jgi:hypothetical protein
VLVALALMGSTPVITRAGKEMKLPPPATELRAPPSMAAIKRTSACKNVIFKVLPGISAMMQFKVS